MGICVWGHMSLCLPFPATRESSLLKVKLDFPPCLPLFGLCIYYFTHSFTRPACSLHLAQPTFFLPLAEPSRWLSQLGGVYLYTVDSFLSTHPSAPLWATAPPPPGSLP